MTNEPPSPVGGDYRAARIGAAAALTAVVVMLLLADVVVPGYDLSAVVLMPLLGMIATLLGIEVVDIVRGTRK